MRGNGVWGYPAPFEVGRFVVLSHDLQGFIYSRWCGIFFHELNDMILVTTSQQKMAVTCGNHVS